MLQQDFFEDDAISKHLAKKADRSGKVMRYCHHGKATNAGGFVATADWKRKKGQSAANYAARIVGSVSSF